MILLRPMAINGQLKKKKTEVSGNNEIQNMDQLGIEGMEFAEIMKNISSTNGRVRLGNMLSRDNSKKIRRSNGINTK